MLLKGLEEVVVGTYKSMNEETIDKVWVLNNASGGPTQMQIQNTSPQVSQTYAGDALFRVTGKGTGQVQGTFAAQDIPGEVLRSLLGYTKDATSGLWLAGKDTPLVYGAIYAKTHDISDEVVWISILKGTFSRGDINPQTNQAQETDATDTLTITGVNRKSDGFVYAEGSSADGTTEDQVRKFIFPGYSGTFATVSTTVEPAK